MGLIIVISDLHLGSGLLDDFDLELEENLAEFLNELSAKNSNVELVINGDFLDFAQAFPWKEKELRSISKDGTPLCFTENQSLEKLEGIYNQHKLTFKSLREFLSSKKGNILTILPGNHDVDFFWPNIRKLFSEKVSLGNTSLQDQIKFHLEQSYSPDGLSSIRIEHGHQYDPINRFFVKNIPYWSESSPPIFKDLNGVFRLYECIGTRFLNKYLNYLDESYPFVDNVKPFSKFLTTFGLSSLFFSGYGPVKASIAVWGMVNFLGNTSLKTPKDLLSQENENLECPLRAIKTMVNKFSSKKREKFYDEIKGRGYPINKSFNLIEPNSLEETAILEFLSENLDIFDNFESDNISTLDSKGKQGTLALTKGFTIDETEELKKVSEKIFEHGETEVLIMGHTHEVVLADSKFKYFNTGCWTRFFDFNTLNNFPPWRLLKTNSYKYFPYKLNYVEINPKTIHLASLKTFKEKFHE